MMAPETHQTMEPTVTEQRVDNEQNDDNNCTE